MGWIIFVAGAVLSWGAYGALLHMGQTQLGNPLKALLCVGVAYFLIGVIVPVIALGSQGNLSNFNSSGLITATIAGALGAGGAACIIWAFRTGGLPGLRDAARVRRRPDRQRPGVDGDSPAQGRHQPADVRRVRSGVGRRGHGAVLPAHCVISAQTTQSDCVVVGASFAGLACATALARAGMRVTVLERKADVGEKLHTTGIIVKDAIDQIALLDGLPPAMLRRIDGVRLYSPTLRHVDLSAPGYYFLATDTPQLMRWLAERALQAGANIEHQTSFVTAQRTQSGFDLGEGRTTRFIVGADGPNSRVAQMLGLGRNTKFLFGVEHE